MAENASVALIGAGGRGQYHLQCIYHVRDETHRDRTPDDSSLAKPHTIYETHAAEPPVWAKSVADLQPSVTAVIDPDPSARKAAAAICREHGDTPEKFASFDGILTNNLFDTAVVASPNHTHVDYVVPLLNHGVNVLCEKPLATTLPDHDCLIEADQATDALFYVGFNMRHSPLYQRLSELVHAGTIGRVDMIDASEVRTPFPEGHYYTNEESGGSLLEKDCHDFDLFNWLLNANPVTVGAFGGQHVFSEETDVIDNATAIVKYDSGAVASLDLCLHAPFSQTRGRNYDVRGSDGLIRTAKESNAWELYTRETHDTVRVTETGDGHGGADVRQMRHFLRCLQGDVERPATPLDAKKAAAVAIGAHVSIDEDIMIEIDKNYDLQY